MYAFMPVIIIIMLCMILYSNNNNYVIQKYNIRLNDYYCNNYDLEEVHKYIIHIVLNTIKARLSLMIRNSLHKILDCYIAILINNHMHAIHRIKDRIQSRFGMQLL